MARRVLSLDDLDKMEIDEANRLFWKGQPIALEQRISLRSFELCLATAAALGALLAGIHPFGVTFGWW